MNKNVLAVLKGIGSDPFWWHHQFHKPPAPVQGACHGACTTRESRANPYKKAFSAAKKHGYIELVLESGVSHKYRLTEEGRRALEGVS